MYKITYRQAALSHYKRVDKLIYREALTHAAALDTISAQPQSSWLTSILRIIIGQQLSTKAASTIWQRLNSLVTQPAGGYTTTSFDKITDQQLRSAGTSGRKLAYIRGFCRSVQQGDINFSGLDDLPDEAVIRELTSCPGLGVWSAEMFLISALGRGDVFSTKDLALMTAASRLYGLPRHDQRIVNKLERLSPYRTGVALVMWRSLDI